MTKSTLKQIALFCAVIFSFASRSQVQQNPTSTIVQPEKCGFEIIHQQRMANDPVYYQNTIDFDNAMANYVAPKVGNTTLRVPVVVHVMDDGTSLTQITDEEIRQGIQRINERFRKVPGSLGDGNGVDTELEFVLAVRDPSGNCTDGIVRYDLSGNSTYTSAGVFANSAGITDGFLKAQSFWNSSNYYNFWLVSEIDNNNGGSGIQGYAFFASAHGSATDGTVMLCNNFKSSTSTTATHELGHAFDLYHTFEGDGGGGSCPPNANCNTQGDRVCDTPPHVRSVSNCVTAPNPCDGGSSSDLFIHNYMDYSSDACQSEFTAGQKVRISNAMTVTRASFLASNGNLSLIPPAPPVVDFQASADFFCIGNPIQFFDISSCTPNTFLDSTYWSGITFNWAFTNGVDNYSSTLQNPLMNFPNPGVYDVTLTVTNGQGSNTLTQNGFFTIGSSPIAACTPSSNNIGNFQQCVSNVTFNSINNTTSTVANGEYADYTCQFNTFVTAGSTYPLDVTISAGGSAPEVVEVYIDYNNNGTFEAGELVHSGTTGGTSTSVLTSSNITIPGTAVQGALLRMRVMGEANTINSNERNCTSSFFIGDVEDYGVYIEPSCATPTIALGTISNPSTCSGTDGSIVITGSGTGTVDWSGTSSGSSGSVTLPYTISGLGAGSYSITFSTSPTCTSNTLNSTLTDPTSTVISVGTISDPTVCGGSDGTIQVMGSGTGDIVWNGAAGGFANGITLPYTITGLVAGTFSIDFSSGGCSSNTVSQTLTDPGPPTIAVGSSTNPSVCGASDGTIDITGTGTGDISWSGPTAGSASGISLPYTISGLTAGIYSINFTTSIGCVSNSVSETLNDPAAPTISIGAINDPSCGASDGTIEITGSGTGDISFTGTLNGNSNGVTLPFTITNLIGGTYTITFTEAGCASNQVSQTLNQPTTIPIAVGTTANPTVCAASDGTIQITGSGTGDISWSGTASGSSNGITLPYTISGLAAGTYSIDFVSGGCNSNTLSQTLSDPAAPTISVGTFTGPSSCLGTNGSIQITGSGTGDISWSGSAAGSATGVTLPYVITGLSAGTYSIDFTSGGCSSNTISQTLTDPAAPTIAVGIITDPSVCQGTDGMIEITGSGTGDVSWSGAASGSSTGVTLPFTITGLAAGTYSIDFIASTGCASNTVSQTLTDPAAPTISIGTFAGPITCLGTDGVIQITGTGTGDISWSGTASGSATGITLPYTITGLAAGTYSIDFTTSTGCASNTVSQTLTDPAAPTIAVGTITDPSVCQGTDGMIEITGSGTGDVSWSGAASGSSTSVTLPFTITGLVAGTYAIDFIASTGCASNTVSQTLTDPAAPTIAIGTFAGPTFCSGTNGTIQITGSGTGDILVTGAGSLTIPGITLPYTITSLAENTYTVTFTTSTGCTSNSVTQTISDPPTPVIAVGVSTDPTVCLGADGTIEITGSGTGTVNWTGTAIGSSGTVTLPYTITGLTAGTYSISFTSSVFCMSNTVSQSLISPAAPTITVGTFAGPSTCSGTDGVIQITGSGSGNISWSGTASGSATGITLPYTITGLAAGTYSIDFTTSTGCVANTVSETITDPAAPAIPVISANGPTQFCAGGSVDLTSSYTNGNVWSTSDITQTITANSAGSYSVTHTDANGCSSTSVPVLVSVNAIPSAPTIAASGSTTFCAGGSVDLTSSEATGNDWSTTDVTQTITATTSGAYDVTYTDGNGCSATSAPITVTVNALPAVPTISSSGPTTFCDGGTVDLTSSETTGNVWSTTDVTQTITASTSGLYDVTFTDGNGCSSTSSPVSVVVNAIPAPPVITPSGSTTLCVGQTVDLTSSQTTGNLWSTTDVTQTITVSATGSYDVTYTDGNGCSAISTPVSVSGGNQPTVSAGSDTTVCENEMITLTGSGAQTYVWTGGIIDNVPFTPPAGSTTYTLVGTDANGCADTAMVNVTVSPAPTVSLATDATTCVYYAPSILVGTPSGGIFLGANVSGNQFDPASAGVGTHTVYYEFENATGCIGEANTTIIVEACSSLEDLTNNDVKVYPNPMQDLLNIELDGPFNLTLFDSRARLVYRGSGNDALTISTAEYEAGVYMLNISNEQNSSVIRVLKQ